MTDIKPDAPVEIRTQSEAPEQGTLELSIASLARLSAELIRRDTTPQRTILQRVLDDYYADPAHESCEKCGERMIPRYVQDEGGWIAARPVNAGTIQTDHLVAFVACECGEYGLLFRGPRM